MRRRRILSKRRNRRNFRRTAMRVHRKNLGKYIARGGYRF